MADGRLLYAAWHRATFDDGVRGRLALESINTDGSDRAPLVPPPRLAGSSACPASRRQDWSSSWRPTRFPGDGAGRLVARLAAPAAAHVPADHRPAGWTVLHSPSPLPDGRILVSWRPGGWLWLLRHLSAGSGDGPRELVLDDPRFHEIQARSRARPAAARWPIQRGLAR